jgi:hypothetical protein
MSYGGKYPIITLREGDVRREPLPVLELILDRVRRSVEVEAEGLYETSGLGLRAFRKHSAVTHTLTVTKVQEWLQRGVRTPKEAVLKERQERY